MTAPVVLVFLLLGLTGTAAADLPTVTHEGRAYVELTRVATSLGGTLEASPESPRAQLRAQGHVVTLTRNWSQVLVDGKPFVLGAPVRVSRGVWLVPETFLGEVVPRLRASTRERPATPVAMPRAAPLAEVTLEELRSRSYPSFTRIVLETTGPLTHRIEAGSPGEARVRLLRLRGAAQVEEIRDGFVSEGR
ncbi:MAG: stalk domain-containing protein, partial [Gemmatimonadales bacterium]|nr:stalk domain-containing protein [Gemmatimonadales bacterium]